MDTMRNKVQIVKSDSRDRFYFFFYIGKYWTHYNVLQ